MSIFSSQNTLGLDIGYETLKLVELKKSGKNFVVVGTTDYPLTERILEKDKFKDKAAAAKMIQEACNQAKPNQIRANRVVTALPETFVFSKTIQLPKMKEKEYEKAVPLEAAQCLPIPVEEAYLDYQILVQHPEAPMVDILLVATSKRLIDEYLEIAKMANLDLVAIETKPLAAGRAILTAKDNGTMIIEIGSETCRLSIWESTDIRLATTIGVGKNQIDKSLISTDEQTRYEKDNLKKSEVLAEIIEEIMEAIKYHQNRDFKPEPIEKILLCGSGGKINNLASFIEEKTKIKCDIARPNVAGKNQLGTEFAAAAGLAMRTE